MFKLQNNPVCSERTGKFVKLQKILLVSTTEQTTSFHLRLRELHAGMLEARRRIIILANRHTLLSKLNKLFHPASDTRPFIVHQKSLPSTLPEEIPMRNWNRPSVLLCRIKENIRRSSIRNHNGFLFVTDPYVNNIIPLLSNCK